MTRVVGIRFKQAGKIYHFSPGTLEPKLGEHVIVETSRGIEYGKVAAEPYEEEDNKVVQPLKEVIRMATEEDKAHEADNKKKEMEAFAICFDKIKKHELNMKLIDCEITFDNSKILFYFTAEGRIDFRELVKDLAAVFHTRIELRQEGVRDETKTLGGLGCCGRELCCHSYLNDFVPVSIKMAKTQNLSLNTSKISGVCGRLMCCLKYEENVYEELNKKLPSQGDYAVTPDGLRGTVSSVNILKQMVKVLVELPNDDKEIREYHADELKVKSRRKGAPRNEFDDEWDGETSGEELPEAEASGDTAEADADKGNASAAEREKGSGNHRDYRAKRERSGGRNHRERSERKSDRAPREGAEESSRAEQQGRPEGGARSERSRRGGEHQSRGDKHEGRDRRERRGRNTERRGGRGSEAEHLHNSDSKTEAGQKQ